MLRYSSALLLVPALHYKQNHLLSFMLVATFICSQWFWSNPIRNSTLHTFDARIAKATVAAFVIYTFYTGRANRTYVALLAAMAIAFYLSHRFSSICWCSNKHIVCHGLLHCASAVAACYA